MIVKRDFIITGLQPWDLTFGSNAKDIAIEISKNNRVLYVNSALDKKTLWRGENTPEYRHRRDVIKKKKNPLRQISPSLWVLDYPFSVWPINFLPDGNLFDLINSFNNRKMYSYVRKVSKNLGFKDTILFIDNDIYRSFYASEHLEPALAAYYRRDNMVNAYWLKHAPRLEPLLCEKSDVVVTNSIQLAKAVSAYNPHCYDVGQGVDLSNYNKKITLPLPKDMENIPRPIVGYLGAIITLRLDAELIFQVASRCPDYSFVMVGGEDEEFKKHPVHTLKNVYFLGLKPQSETIAYMAHFDVCTNPQIVNETTIGNYPRKIDEYLALGKPVIATQTDAMEMFKEYTWNCIGVDQYVKAIKEALLSNTPENIQKRIDFANTHSWSNSVEKIYEAIEKQMICE